MRRVLVTALALAGLALPAAAEDCLDGPMLVSDGGARHTPGIEVAFVLDTTGSMSALIEGAKETIWSIASALASAEEVPSIRMGLIGYRDRGDAYVTERTDLTADIDLVYDRLLAFEADGGGDFPESVNQALWESVNDLNWSTGCHDLKAVFLVGDAPPGDYPDDIDWPETVEIARARGITINTLLAGNNDVTRAVWREIEAAAKGRFAAIPASGGAYLPETPFDADIAALNVKLNHTVLTYGTAAEQRDVAMKLRNTESASLAAQADIASFRAATGAGEKVLTGRGDLLADLAEGMVALDDLSEEALPGLLQGLNEAEREQKLAEMSAERKALTEAVQRLNRQRADWLRRWEADNAGEQDAAFNREIVGILQEQAAPYGIVY